MYFSTNLKKLFSTLFFVLRYVTLVIELITCYYNVEDFVIKSRKVIEDWL